MFGILLGLFVIAHGLVHLAVWGPPPSNDAPIQTARSWLLGDMRPLAVGLAIGATVLLTAGGIAVLTEAGWWPWLVIAGSAVSVLLMALTFTPWWLFGLAIDAAVVRANAPLTRRRTVAARAWGPPRVSAGCRWCAQTSR